MPNAATLLDKEQKHRIIEAIRSAEKASSAELRVHIENHCKGEVLDRAVEVFAKLKMDRTELRNGVLVYLAIKDRKTAIIGDENINKHVHHDFWDVCYKEMKSYFAKEEFTEGICAALKLLETELANHFPHSDDDVNELPDEISIG